MVRTVGEPRVINGIPRFGEVENYSDSFGFQWKRFAETQLTAASSRRFWTTTDWKPEELAGKDVLEVGSGAGRFSRVILCESQANLYSLDYSSAVEANWANNGSIDPDRFRLFQASIYDMPFADGSFDKTFCLGVLQHTPDFGASVEALVKKTKPGGEIVVDFYAIKGWWTKIHAKYLLRPMTKRMPHDRLLRLISSNIDRLIAIYRMLGRLGLQPLTRFVPIADIEGTFPKDLSEEQLRDWAILDTFDMFSPEYDQPQKLSTVVRMFEGAGARVTFADFIDGAAVVRAVRL